MNPFKEHMSVLLCRCKRGSYHSPRNVNEFLLECFPVKLFELSPTGDPGLKDHWEKVGVDTGKKEGSALAEARGVAQTWSFRGRKED